MSALNQAIRVLQRWPLVQAPRPDWMLVLAIVPTAVRDGLAAYTLIGDDTMRPSEYTGCELLGVHVVFNPVLPRELMQLIVKEPFCGLSKRIGIDVDLVSTVELRRYEIIGG